MAAPPRVPKISAAPDFEAQETRLRGERGGLVVSIVGKRKIYRRVAGQQFADISVAEAGVGEKTFGRPPIKAAGQS